MNSEQVALPPMECQVRVCMVCEQSYCPVCDAGEADPALFVNPSVCPVCVKTKGDAWEGGLKEA